MPEPAPSSLEGRWQMIRAEFGGERAPVLFTQKTQIEFQAGEYIVRFSDGIADRGSFHAVENESTKSAILVGREGPNAGKTVPCIYQIAGNRLRICFGLDGAKPTEFPIDGKSTNYLATYVRLK